MSTCQQRSRRSALLLPTLLLLPIVGATPVAAQSTTTRTGDMTVQRLGPTATLLSDGRVLVTGGLQTDATGTTVPNSSAEIFDPATAAFTATGSMSVRRVKHAAVRLLDGRVLVIGGSINPTTDTDLAELFEPAQGTFSVASRMSMPREQAAAALLKDGRVLVMGGVSFNPNGSYASPPSTDTYASAGESAQFAPGPRMEQTHWGDAAVTLPEGRVLIFGGQTVNSAGFIVPGLPDVERFDPATGRFSVVGQLNENRESAAATLLPDGRVVVSGGYTLLFAADGVTPTHALASQTVEVFGPVTGTSTTAAPMSEGRYLHTAVALTDGRVLLAGGYTGQDANHTVASADLFDPATGKITPTTPLLVAREEAAAVRLLDGSVLIMGGGVWAGGHGAGGHGSMLQTAEIYRP